MSSAEGLTVAELSRLVYSAVRGLPRTVIVRGQIGNLSKGHVGHIFASLREKRVGVRCFFPARVVGRCDCHAVVARRSKPEVIAPPPGVMASAYREIRQRLERTIVGHSDVLQRLALAGARHVHMGGRQRLLLIGRSGSGKTTMGVAVAAALDCPALVWDVSTSSESGWAGVDAGGALAELYQQCDRDLEIMSMAVAILDELDKLACRDATGTVRSSS